MPSRHSAAAYDIDVIRISGGKAGKTIANLSKVPCATSIGELKMMVERKGKMSHFRQSVRLGLGKEFKNVKDDNLLEDLHDFKQNATGHQAQIFIKDLGPQIAWKTVFLTEYG